MDVQAKIQEALVLGRGDMAKAVRALQDMCVKDERLLRALIQPFLPGILAHAVQKAIGAAGGRVRQASGTPPRAPVSTVQKNGLTIVKGQTGRKPQAVPTSVLDALLEKLGQELPVKRPDPTPRPKTGADIANLLGADPNAPLPPTRAGKVHQASIHVLAKSFKR
ncbi:MAG: hypothetical protein EAZ99_18050 [Alphaproteobacteria bacterium]|nr:MAG: hypothetical protein EAZ99_18050 [Alphaproteobacteria bacterium]